MIRHHLWNPLSQLLGLGLAFLLAGLCPSCACGRSRAFGTTLVEVWTQPGWPPDDLSAPASFRLTPREAYTAVARSKKLSLKHQWFCFRDDQYYYIADAFRRSPSAKAALREGLRVDGQKGTVLSP